MKMLTRSLACEVTERAAPDGKKTFTFVASTDSIDRYGEVVSQDWDLKGFDSNPVILWAHNPNEPIGRGAATMMDGKLKVDVEFHELTERSKDIASLVEAKFLNAVSVGFIPKSVKFEKRGEKEVPVLSGNELLEISVVSIPANPDALAERAFLRSIAGSEPAVRKEHSMRETVIKMLGLAADVTDEQIEESLANAVSNGEVLERVDTSVKLFLESVGAESLDAVAGKLAALEDAAEKLPVIEQELATLKAAQVSGERETIIGKLKAEGRVSPKQIEMLSKQPLEFVKAFAECAPAIPQLAQTPVAQPKLETANKNYEDMSVAEKTALKTSDPARFDALRNDYLARTGRA